MSSRDYYQDHTHYPNPRRPRLNAPLPPVPSESSKNLSPHETSTVLVSPISSNLSDDNGDYHQKSATDADKGYFDLGKYDGTDQRGDPFRDSAAIPLQSPYNKTEQDAYHRNSQLPYPGHDMEALNAGSKTKRRRFTKTTPWFIYCLSLIQISVFIAELVKNGVLTGTPIQTSPQFNPMIGPSPYILINMGARYVPCMRNQADVQNATTVVSWPCPWQTDSTARCTLSQLCGFSGVPNPHPNGSLEATPAPNQWYRFIIPIFLHAGLIHIGFNMLLQILLGGDMERAIGPLRLAVVYFSSGIFGFVMGGNFAASGIASTGASGSLFGIIALTLLDLLYTWSQRKNPVRELLFIILDIVISFVLGLLPGLDNFSHIGGFLMGLVLGVCLLRSPISLQQKDNGSHGPARQKHHIHDGSRTSLVPHSSTTSNSAKKKTRKTVLSRPTSNRAFSSPKSFFSNRPALWWAWWLIRAAALVGVVAAFIALVKAFYDHHETECSWCKYLSCLPVNNWCDLGNLTFSPQGSGGS